MTERIGAPRYSDKLLCLSMIPIILCFLFGPLSVECHRITSTMDNTDEILENIEKHLLDLQNLKTKKSFFQKCRANNLLPEGLTIDLNLALGVNDSLLVMRIQDILDQASSNILDTLEIFCDDGMENLESKIDEYKEGGGI